MQVAEARSGKKGFNADWLFRFFFAGLVWLENISKTTSFNLKFEIKLKHFFFEFRYSSWLTVAVDAVVMYRRVEVVVQGKKIVTEAIT